MSSHLFSSLHNWYIKMEGKLLLSLIGAMPNSDEAARCSIFTQSMTGDAIPGRRAPPAQITKMRKLTKTESTRGETAKLGISSLYQEGCIYTLLRSDTLMAVRRGTAHPRANMIWSLAVPPLGLYVLPSEGRGRTARASRMNTSYRSPTAHLSADNMPPK
jgi:hypothetical protein